MPSTGRLIRYRPPREGTTVDGITTRLDSGVVEGGEISVYYDPMIAKLITHAPTRLQAIEHMGEALDAFAIDGFRHNIPFLSVLMRNKRWREGRLSTKFIAEEFPGGFKPPLPTGEERDAIVAIAATIDHMSNQRRRAITQQMHGEPVQFAEVRIIEIAGAAERVTVAGDVEGPFTVIFEGGGKTINLASNWWFGDPVWKGTIDGKRAFVQIRPILNGYDIIYEGVEVPVRVLTEREAELAALMLVKEKADTSKFLLCPMPGMVVSLAVDVGQDVRAGDTLCVVEAMKMENVLKAERDGRVSKVLAKPGDSLNVDAVILEFA
jgi:propionyl-CoA carboxylase alpha chain